jgi:VanZ family protein
VRSRKPHDYVALYAPAAAWAGVLLWLGSQTGLKPPSFYLADKLAHAAMYSVLGMLAALGWWKTGRMPRAHWPILLAMAVGLGDELHQRIVPGRTADPRDWIADTIGILVGFGAVAYLTRDRRKVTGA